MSDQSYYLSLFCIAWFSICLTLDYVYKKLVKFATRYDSV